MAWYDLNSLGKSSNLSFNTPANVSQVTENNQNSTESVLYMDDMDDDGDINIDNLELYKRAKTDPSDNDGLYKIAKPESSEDVVNENSRNIAENIVNAIGSSFAMDGGTGIGKTDFAAILHNLNLYNDGKAFDSAVAEFFDIINKGLQTLGIDSESPYAENYIKELIKAISNADKDPAKLASNGINLSADALSKLDKNGDGSFFDELNSLALSDEVLVSAQKKITQDMISDEMDSDNDGYITFEEIKNSFDNNGAIASLFVNDNGNFDAAIFYAISNIVDGQYKVTPELLLAWLDTDNNGKITSDDIERFKSGEVVDPTSFKDSPVYIDAYSRGLDIAYMHVKHT